MQDELRDYVPDVSFELIPIKNLVSNQEYQRGLSSAHIKRMVENFDLHQINLVKVSRRNGINLVMNGQHTIETVAAKSGSRETPVWCMIYCDLVYQTEADIFANQMRYTKSLSPYDVFIANVEAGHDEQLMIKSLVESYQMCIAQSSNCLRGICAVSALERIFEKYGYHTLDQTLYLIISTWEGDAVSFSGNMLRGVAKLMNSFGDKLKQDLFVERLGRISPKEITRCAKERRNGSLGFAEALLVYYNKKTKCPLRWNSLYHDDADNTDEDEDRFTPDTEERNNGTEGNMMS